jgi:hypothetical protein
MVNKFIETMEMLQFLSNQINLDNTNIFNQMSHIEEMMNTQCENVSQLMSTHIESMKQANTYLSNTINLTTEQTIQNINSI